MNFLTKNDTRLNYTLLYTYQPSSKQWQNILAQIAVVMGLNPLTLLTRNMLTLDRIHWNFHVYCYGWIDQ